MDLSVVDYRPLSEKPSKDDVAGVRTQALAGKFGKASANKLHEERGTAILVTTVSGGFLTAIFALTTIVQWAQGEDGDDLQIAVGATLVLALLTACAYLIGRVILQPRGWRRSVRFVLFGRANGLDARPQAKATGLPGPLGRRRFRTKLVSEHLRWTQNGLSAQSGVYQDSSSNSRANVGISIRYLAVKLSTSAASASFHSGRKVAAPLDDSAAWVNVLDTGSDRQVRLMCDAADRDVVRAFFSDTLIDVLANPRHPADAQIDGDWFIAYYSPRGSLDPTLWQSIFSVVGRLDDHSSSAAETAV